MDKEIFNIMDGILIDAAGKYASAYDDDDRQDIRVDVMNAYFNGSEFYKEAYLSKCAEVRELRDRVREWQPIETAQEGDVLVWCGWCMTAMIQKDERGFMRITTEDGASPIYHATHWMPLPEAPTND